MKSGRRPANHLRRLVDDAIREALAAGKHPTGIMLGGSWHTTMKKEIAKRGDGVETIVTPAGTLAVTHNRARHAFWLLYEKETE